MPKKYIEDILKVVDQGGGVVIDASKKTYGELLKIAMHAHKSGASVVMRHADAKNSDELVKIAAQAPGKIIFEF